ncbi:MAG TPA: hypothetical protein VF582_09705 [Allosphingosinicella sp.]|jgi:hypothetical protein
MRGFIVLSLATALSATPAFAADPVKVGEEKNICKSTRVIGSNIPLRVCKTKSQWDYERKQSKDAMDFNRPVPVPNTNR